MESTLVLFYALGIILIATIVIQYYLWRDRKKDKNCIEDDWQKFLDAVSRNNNDELIRVSEKLIWNKYLKVTHLDIMLKIIENEIEENDKMKELYNKLKNRKLHYDRPLPSPDSSGGKKQSW